MQDKDLQKTDMGGENEKFQTTVWKEISRIKSASQEDRKNTVNNLIESYWKPVYCYLRRKGHDNESAKDITQSFLMDIVLGRELFMQAEKKKGRFRTFLLTALDRYLVDLHRKDNAQKRSPSESLRSLDTAELSRQISSNSSLDPQQVFNYVWASELLKKALNTIKTKYLHRKKENHWEIFYERVIKPITDNSQEVSLSDICLRYGIENEAKASEIIYRVKLEFRDCIRNCLRSYVNSDSEVEEEFNDMFRILSHD
jgi:RNA polymerase sigma-70 factor (ECF subfamily)